MFQKLFTLIKDWTLPFAILTGTAVYLIFYFLPSLDAAGDFLCPIIMDIFPCMVFLVLFTTFCKIDFRRMRPVRWHLWVLMAQIIMTAVLVVMIKVFFNEGTSKLMCEGVLMCIIGPTAAAAAVVTAKIGGDITSMTAYTLMSSVLSAIIIPLTFPLIEDVGGMSFIGASVMILRKVMLILVAPLLISWIVRHYLPNVLHWILSRPNLSFYLWCFCLTITTGVTVRNIVHSNAPILVLVLMSLMSLAICVFQFALGRRLGRRYGRSIDSGQALGQKNTAFAIWVASSYLNPASTIGPGCYVLWQNIVNSVEIRHYSKARAHSK